jgi:hypothetical protein
LDHRPVLARSSGRGEGGAGDCAAEDAALEAKTSQSDSLHLPQCNLVLCPIVKFGCSRRLMAGHLLGVLEPSVVLQINRDAGCTPGVTFDNTLGLGSRKREKLNAPVVDPKPTF